MITWTRSAISAPMFSYLWAIDMTRRMLPIASFSLAKVHSISFDCNSARGILNAVASWSSEGSHPNLSFSLVVPFQKLERKTVRDFSCQKSHKVYSNLKWQPVMKPENFRKGYSLCISPPTLLFQTKNYITILRGFHETHLLLQLHTFE